MGIQVIHYQKQKCLEVCKLKLSREQFIEQFVYYVTEMQKAMEKDDYRANNRYVTILMKKIKKLKQKTIL